MIVDDQKIFREGLKMLISKDSAIQVVALCENGQEAIDSLAMYQPDLILMDIQMPVLNGVEAVKHIDIPVIMLTTFHDENYIFEAIKNGARGYLLKDTDIDIIIQAIKTVYQGGGLMDPEVTKIMMTQFSRLANHTEDAQLLEGLTEREQLIAKYVAEGFNNKEIGEKIFIGEGTVKNHLTRILQKLELRDRTQLAIYVLKSGF